MSLYILETTDSFIKRQDPSNRPTNNDVYSMKDGNKKFLYNPNSNMGDSAGRSSLAHHWAAPTYAILLSLILLSIPLHCMLMY
jgi:hypothetical protein